MTRLDSKERDDAANKDNLCIFKSSPTIQGLNLDTVLVAVLLRHLMGGTLITHSLVGVWNLFGVSSLAISQLVVPGNVAWFCGARKAM